MSNYSDSTPPTSEREPLGEPEYAPESTEPLVVQPEPEPVVAPRAHKVPNFEDDARQLQVYEDTKRHYHDQVLSSAAHTIERSFAQRREQLQTELANARTYEDDRRASALAMGRQYANVYPHRIDSHGARPPGFFENLFSLGRARKLYHAALFAREAFDALRGAIRKREEALAALESELMRAVELKQDQLRKWLESDAGVVEFHERPEIAPLFERVDEICREREDYQRRLQAGAVSGEEQRDRALAHIDLDYAEIPLLGVIVVKIERFGSLTYFRLRDLGAKETLLSYDPRLDRLRSTVFDVFHLAGRVVAKVKRNEDGTPYRIADHFKLCSPDQDTADEAYREHRGALRRDRELPPTAPCDENEAAIVDALLSLVQALEAGQARPGIDEPLRV